MTAYRRKATVKTWFEAIHVMWGESSPPDYSDIEATSLGYSPTLLQATKKAQRLTPRASLISPRLTSNEGPVEFFRRTFSADEEGYYIAEVDLVHENGRTSLGRVVTHEWVYPYRVRRRPKPRTKTTADA